MNVGIRLSKQSFGGCSGQDFVDEVQGGAGIDGPGAVEFLAQRGDGVVLGLGGQVHQLHGQRAGGWVGPQAGVVLEQRLDQRVDFRGFAEVRRERRRGQGLGLAGDYAQAVEQAPPGLGQGREADLFRQLADEDVRVGGRLGSLQAGDALLDLKGPDLNLAPPGLALLAALAGPALLLALRGAGARTVAPQGVLD